MDPPAPGAFPVDDMAETTYLQSTAAAGTETGPNKLHKANDPRGFADNGKSARGHAHTDSGVGLEQARDPILPQPADVSEKSQIEAPTDDGIRNDHQLDTTETTFFASGLGSADPVNAESHAAVEENKIGDRPEQSDSSDRKNPYWGDLPRGAGVYNTVAGHGSPEDNITRQRGQQDAELDNKSSELDNSSSEQRSFPLMTADQTTGYEDTSKTEKDQSKHYGEAAGATAMAGAGLGAAAYETNKKNDERVNSGMNEDKTEQEKSEPKKESKLHALFHRGSKNDTDKKEDKSEEKGDKQPKQEKEHKLTAIFHRSDKKEDGPEKEEAPEQKPKDATVVATPYIPPKEEEKPPATRSQPETYEKSSEVPPKAKDDNRDAAIGLAAAGAGGVGTYAAVKALGDREETEKSHSSAAFDDQQVTQVDKPTKASNDGNYEYLASGTASGVQKEAEPELKQATPLNKSPPASSNDPLTASDHDMAKAAALTAVGATAGTVAYEKTREPEKPVTADDSVVQPQEQLAPIETTPVVTKEAAVRTSEPDHLEEQRPPVVQETFTDTSVPHRDELATAATTSAAVVPAELTTSPAGRHAHDTLTQEAEKSEDYGKHDPAEPANKGMYNVMASGTPSGIRMEGDEEKNTAPTEPETKPAEAPVKQSIPVAAASDFPPAKEEPQLDPVDEKPEVEERQLPKDTQEVVNPIPTNASQNKVIHRCHKCGEDNDITAYFESGARDKQ